MWLTSQTFAVNSLGIGAGKNEFQAYRAKALIEYKQSVWYVSLIGLRECKDENLRSGGVGSACHHDESHLHSSQATVGQA